MIDADYKALEARIANLEERVGLIHKASGLLLNSIKSIIEANRMMLADIDALKTPVERRPAPWTGPK